MSNYNQPPIPDPFLPPSQGSSGFSSSPRPPAPRDWKSAPPIVRGWAYPLTLLGIVVLPLMLIASLMGLSNPAGGKSSPGENVVVAAIYFVALVVTLWLNFGLKKGVPAAWTVQLIGSILGLCGFPLGTAIHAYILSQWSKPEVKAWFGKR